MKKALLVIDELRSQKEDIIIPMTKKERLVRELKLPEFIRDYVLKQLKFYKI